MWCIDQLNASSEYAMIIKYLSTATLVISGLLLGANVTQAQNNTTNNSFQAPVFNAGASNNVVTPNSNQNTQNGQSQSQSQTSSKMSPESQNPIDFLLKSFLGKLF
jgi:hypothetical protein